MQSISEYPLTTTVVGLVFTAPGVYDYMHPNELGSHVAGPIKGEVFQKAMAEVLIYNNFERAASVLDSSSGWMMDDEMADVIDRITDLATLVEYHPHTRMLTRIAQFLATDCSSYKPHFKMIDRNTIVMTLYLEGVTWEIHQLNADLSALSSSPTPVPWTQ